MYCDSAGGVHIGFAHFNFNYFACRSVYARNRIAAVTAGAYCYLLNNAGLVVCNVGVSCVYAAEIHSVRRGVLIKLPVRTVEIFCLYGFAVIDKVQITVFVHHIICAFTVTAVAGIVARSVSGKVIRFVYKRRSRCIAF